MSTARSFSKKMHIRTSPEDAFSEEEAKRIIEYALKLPALMKSLRGKRYRILRAFSEMLKDGQRRKLRYATLVMYNYSDDLTHIINLDLRTAQIMDTKELAIQPGPSSDEYEEAINLIKKERSLLELLDSKSAVIQKGLIVQDPDEELPAGIHRCLEMFLCTPERDRFLHRLVIDLSAQSIVVNEEGGQE